MFTMPANHTAPHSTGQAPDAEPVVDHGRRHPRLRAVVALFCAAGLVMAACGSDSEDAAAGDTDTADAPAAEASDSDTGAIVSTGSTDLGDVLVDEAGLSLYGFLPDEGGTPTCGGACADAWPPVTVSSADLPEGLDPNVFGVVDGVDGGFQLTAGGWPLYRFAGDSAPGDIAGQGSGDAWFLAAPDGSLISDEAAAPAPQPASDESQPAGGYDY